MKKKKRIKTLKDFEPPKLKFRKGVFKIGKSTIISNGKGEHIVINDC